MNRRRLVSLSAITMFGLALLSDSAVSQQKTLKEQLVGTWTFVSSTRADGSNIWGPNPKGLAILMTDGRFSIQIMRSDRPKYASNNRLKGTPEEQKATVEGVVSYFGTYSLDEATKMITLHIESSSFPNWNGTDQKRTITTLTADELKYNNPASSSGTPTVLMWKRVK